MKPETTATDPYGGSPVYYGMPYGMANDDFSSHHSLSPLKLMRIIVRKWWVLALSVLLAISASWFYLTRATVLYKAESLIEMSVRRPRLTDQRTLISSDSDFGGAKADEIFNTRIEKFKGSRMRELAYEQLQAYGSQIPVSPEELYDVVNGVTFQLIRRSYILRVACVSSDAATAAMAANAYADAAVMFSMEENRLTSDNAVAWLMQQATQQKKNLDVLSEKVTAFRESRRFDAMENERDAMNESLKQIGSELTRLDSASILATMLMESLENVKQRPENAGDLPVSTPGRDSIIQAVSAWMDARNEHDALLSRYTPNHPEVQARAGGIERCVRQVAETIQRAHKTAAADAALLGRQTAGLRERMEALARTATELESKIVRLQAERDALQRERDIADMSYNGLLTRIEEARIAADENTTTIKIVERAATPEIPFKPRRLLVLLIGCMLGAGAGCALALLLETIEDRFDGSEDLQQLLGCPVLGLIPGFPETDRSITGQKALNDRFGQSAEAYARIRARLQVASENPPACILVCSAEPKEGKTITAANLAISFARTGVKTLLVDFDMRRPQIKSVFDLDDGVPCLLDVLGSGRYEDFANLPVVTSCPNLSVIANHAVRKYSASEIVGSQIAKDFVAWARSEYELVVIDAPPFGGVSDALNLGAMSDGALFVHRPGISNRRALRHTVAEFTASGNRVLGIVVNGVHFNRMSVFSNYNYHYGSKYYKQDAGDRRTD